MQRFGRAGRRGRGGGERDRASCSGSDGYAAIDTLVALTVLSSTLVFAIAAGHVGRQAARAALEARQARAVLMAAMERAPAEPGVTDAQGGGFAWRLTVREPVLVAGATALCRRDATATALATARRYDLSTAVICPSGET